ncbi:MAG: hypothetical protein EBX09_04630 [Actinobacteria bacterium]|nr:hypothetical protein [Actinomycetota bacterium]NCV83394.1 hypothetical protein [Actinomycetota bacterium]NCV95246.1 hypothetical protein [Actinomycetota bacterium]NCW46925.1 hypothetical protein [Actinomycetota bacterium]NCW75354.1 hypothetical protein [Actinomycetota bacterium]
MKRLSYLIALLALAISALLSVRIGAITLALALATYSIPSFKTSRPLEKIVTLLLVVSLITVALALPRR